MSNLTYHHDGKSAYTVEQTDSGPVVYCNYECDWDEAEGGVYRQCRRCLRVQTALSAAAESEAGE